MPLVERVCLKLLCRTIIRFLMFNKFVTIKTRSMDYKLTKTILINQHKSKSFTLKCELPVCN